jgi:hypothetical protein
MHVTSTLSIAYTSREIPEVKESERTVPSYALVYTFHETKWEEVSKSGDEVVGSKYVDPHCVRR